MTAARNLPFWSGYPESMAVGLDLGGSRARMVCAFPHEGGAIAIHDRDCFSSRARFQRYWDGLMLPHWRPLVVAAGDSDPLGIVAWLEQQGIEPIWSPVFETDHAEELCLLDLPRSYGRAYDLCLTACFQLKSYSVQVELWRECQRLRRGLARVTTHLGRLTGLHGTCPELDSPPLIALPDGPLTVDDIPF